MEQEKKEILIERVRMRTFLYDCNDPNYKDTEMKDAAWEEIGRELGIVDGKAAKGEWKKIRDNFRDALKRQKGLRSGQTAIQIAQYKYYNQLSFLIPYMSNRGLMGMMGEMAEVKAEAAERMSVCERDPPGCGVGGVGGVGCGGGGSLEPPLKRGAREDRLDDRHRRRLQLFASEYNSPLDHFFKTMCETTKLMPQRWQLYVKKEVFNVVCDAEEQILASSVSADLLVPGHSAQGQQSPLSPASTM